MRCRVITCLCRGATRSQPAWEREVGAATQRAAIECLICIRITQIVVDVVIVDAVSFFAFSLAIASQLLQLALTVLLQSGRSVAR